MGRPLKVNSNIINSINNETLKNPILSGDKLSALLQTNRNTNIFTTTINRIRSQQLKFKYQAPRKKPHLTEDHKQSRISFCTDQIHGTINWCDTVIFSDESRFCRHDDSKRVWVKRGYIMKEHSSKKKSTIRE